MEATLPIQRTLTAFVASGAALFVTAQDPYRNRAEVQAALEGLAKSHPSKASLERIGASTEGRPLWVLRLGSPKAPRAIFVAANLEGHAHASTAATLHLAEALLASKDALENTSWLLAPLLNPDAHDAKWEKPRGLRAAGRPLDKDLDGLVGEDGPDDLDGDGLLSAMRFPDPKGAWLPDPADARVMLPADPAKGRHGSHQMVPEGKDDDRDGQYNEDSATGLRPERGFPRGFPVGDREAGPWPGGAPETKAVMDFLLAHREIALAVVLGPANTLLEPPKGSGAPALTDSSRVRPTGFLPRMLGLDPTQDYSVAELWEMARSQATVLGFTRDDLLQQLQPGEAAAPAAEDASHWEKLTESYRKTLEAKGQDPKRAAQAPAAGSLWPWLYYHYGVQTVALDVWGPPKAKTGHDLWAFAEVQAKEAVRPWKPLTLPDGRKVEVGGLDPFLGLAPPAAVLKPALEATTDTLLAWERQLARVALVEAQVLPLGGDLWRITATARNDGAWPTHGRQEARTRNGLPVRLELTPGKGCTPQGMNRAALTERLEGGASFQGTWVVRGEKGAEATLTLRTGHAGGATRVIRLGQER